MQGIVQWIGSHFAASEGIAVVLVIAGAGWALGSRDGGKPGWILVLAGLVLAVWALKVKGLW